MRLFTICVCFVLASACAGRAAVEGGDPVSAIRAFHAALEANQPQRASEQLGPSFFIADESSASDRPKRVRAHLFLRDERLRDWPRRYLEEVGPYRNAFEIVSVSVRGNAAVVITRDTGSNAFRPWRDEEIIWFLGRVENGPWLIAGYVVRDFQAPTP